MKHLLYPIFLLLLAGCSPAVREQIPAVAGFDARRYYGKWYEIARMPNYFEKNLQYVTAEYSPLPDGKLHVVNSGIQNGKYKSISGIARFAGVPTSGELEVSFFRPFYGAYRIIRLTPDYTIACVMGKNRSLAWILARKPVLSEKELQESVNFLRTNGFAVEKLIYPAQKTE